MPLRFLLPALLALLPFLSQAQTYTEVEHWLHLPENRPQLGNQHGDIALSAAGEIYVSVQDPKAPMQVYNAQGQFQRIIPTCPPDFHGFIINPEAGGEFIYGPRLTTGEILKLTLTGETVLSIPPSAIPDQYKAPGATPGLKLTGIAVAPNGDIYVTDGYGLDYIHRFDAAGHYLQTFGGRGEPYLFQNLHKIALDPRFTPPRLLATDRGHNRLVHLSLTGDYLGEVARDLRKPSALFIHDQTLYVAELNGRVSLLDQAGQSLTTLGANDTPGQFGTNKVEPSLWRPNVLNSPHGLTRDPAGNLYISEWNLFGNIHKYTPIPANKP